MQQGEDSEDVPEEEEEQEEALEEEGPQEAPQPTKKRKRRRKPDYWDRDTTLADAFGDENICVVNMHLV